MNILRILDVVAIVLIVKLVQKYFKTYEQVNRILNKNDINSPIESYQYCVSIVTKPVNRTSILCAGSFISRKYVLTAAHCLAGSKTAEVTIHSTYTKPSQLTLESKTFKIHPKWDPKTLSNDVALIEVPTHKLLYQIGVVDLFKKVKIRNKDAWLHGWVKNSSDLILKSDEVVVITNEECEKHYGVLIRSTNICTKPKGFGNGCHGFSGGPLVVKGTQIGVVSFGTTDCNLGYPTIHSKVSKYIEWIKNNSDIETNLR